MNHTFYKASLFLVAMSVPLLGWSFGPCMPIAKACMQQGGYTDKKTMIKDCILPVVRGQKTLPNTSFSAAELQQCKMALVEKMKDKVKDKMNGAS